MTPHELRSARRALHLTQAELAAELGVTMGTVYDWEKGLRPIRRMVDLAIDTLQRQSAMAIATGQTSNRPITPAKDPAEIAATKIAAPPPTPQTHKPEQTTQTIPTTAPPVRYI